MNERIYNVVKPGTPKHFIAIKHGEQGYYLTTVYTQAHADELNRRQGITANEIRAAITCSMFNCWQNFDKLAYKST